MRWLACTWILTFTLAQANASTQTRYVLNDPITLSEMSTLLYGTKRYWKKIAELNRMRPPYVVWVGRRFKLPKTPTLSHEAGYSELQAMWRRRSLGANPLPEESVAAVVAPAAVVEAAISAPERKEAFDRVLATEMPAEELKEQVVERDCANLTVQLSQLQEPIASETLQRGLEDLDRCEADASESLPFRLQRVRLLSIKGDTETAKRVAQRLVADAPQFAFIPFIQKVLNPEPGVQ